MTYDKSLAVSACLHSTALLPWETVPMSLPKTGWIVGQASHAAALTRIE